MKKTKINAFDVIVNYPKFIEHLNRSNNFQFKKVLPLQFTTQQEQDLVAAFELPADI